MTRTEKIMRIKKYRPSLYLLLVRKVPFLISEPEKASKEDIAIYNELIAKEAKKDNNNSTFQKNFLF